MPEYAFLAASVAFAVLSRLIQSVPFRAPDSDTYGHLLFSRQIRDSGGGPLGPIQPNIPGTRPYRHPLLFHWAVSKLQLNPHPRLRFFNATVDGVWIVFLFFLLVGSGFSAVSAALTVNLYAVSPIFFSHLTGSPRTTSLTPRLGAEIIVSLFFFLEVVRPLESTAWTFTLLVVISALALTWSKFASQAIVFVGIFYSGAALTLTPIFAILSGAILVLLISRGKISGVWDAHIAHLVNESRENRNTVGIYARIDHRLVSRTDRLETVSPSDLFRKAVRYSLQVFRGVSKNPITLVTLFFPTFFVALVFALLQIGSNTSSVSDRLSSVLLASALAFVAFSTKKLRFAGEGFRYITHIGPLVILWAVEQSQSIGAEVILVALLVHGFLITLLQLALDLRRSPKQRHLFRVQREMIHLLQGLEDKHKVASFPYFGLVSHWKVLLETDHAVCLDYAFSDAEKSKQTKDGFFDLRRIQDPGEESFNLLIVDFSAFRSLAAAFGKETFGLVEMIASEESLRFGDVRWRVISVDRDSCAVLVRDSSRV